MNTITQWELYNLIVRTLRARGATNIGFGQLILDIAALDAGELAVIAQKINQGTFFDDSNEIYLGN